MKLNKINIQYVLLFGISLCCLIYLNRFLNSGQDHYAHLDRLNSTIFALSNGQFPPLFDFREAADKFGYSWNLFYPPLSILIMVISKYFISLFRDQNSIINMFIGYNILILIIGYIAVYVSLIRLVKTKYVASVGALLFITNHYLITNLLYRMALPEAMAMCFYPLMITGIFLKSRKINNNLFLIGISLITLTHIPSLLVAIVFIGFFIIFNQNRFYLIKNLLFKDAIPYLILTGWFIFPLIYQMTWIHPAIAMPEIKGLHFHNAIMNTPFGGFEAAKGIGFLCSFSLVIMGLNWSRKKDQFSDAIFPILFFLFLALIGLIQITILEKAQFVWRISGIFFFPAVVVILDFLKNNIYKILILCFLNSMLTVFCVYPLMLRHTGIISPDIINFFVDYMDESAENSFSQNYKDFHNNNIVVDNFSYNKGFPKYQIVNNVDHDVSIKSPVIYYRGIDQYVNGELQNCRKESRFCLDLKAGSNIVEYKLNKIYFSITIFLYLISFGYVIYLIINNYKKHKLGKYIKPKLYYPYNG